MLVVSRNKGEAVTLFNTADGFIVRVKAIDMEKRTREKEGSVSLAITAGEGQRIRVDGKVIRTLATIDTVVVKVKPKQTVYIEDLFAQNDIQVYVNRTGDWQSSIGFEAPNHYEIYRDEIIPEKYYKTPYATPKRETKRVIPSIAENPEAARLARQLSDIATIFDMFSKWERGFCDAPEKRKLFFSMHKAWVEENRDRLRSAAVIWDVAELFERILDEWKKSHGRAEVTPEDKETFFNEWQGNK